MRVVLKNSYFSRKRYDGLLTNRMNMFRTQSTALECVVAAAAAAAICPPIIFVHFRVIQQRLAVFNKISAIV